MVEIFNISSLRWLSIFFGIIFCLWSFSRFRSFTISRGEFFFFLLLGLLTFSFGINPNLVSVISDSLSLSGQAYSRIITLLILSNLLLWSVLLYQRSKDAHKNRQFDLLIRHLSSEQFLTDQLKTNLSNIMVIIPAYNEEDAISDVLNRIPKSIKGMPVNVLVVDDGSTDNTVKVVKNTNHMVVSNVINRGGGAALRLGYDIASLAHAQIVVTMDADGQHLPEEMEKLVLPILDNSCDFVIGSRLKGEREKDSIVRLVGIYVFNFLINFLSGTTITDCSNGYRAFRVEQLKKVLLLQDQFHTAELLIDAARKGIRIGEAPITVAKRQAGESKKGKNISYGFNFLKTVLKTWLR